MEAFRGSPDFIGSLESVEDKKLAEKYQEADTAAKKLRDALQGLKTKHQKLKHGEFKKIEIAGQMVKILEKGTEEEILAAEKELQKTFEAYEAADFERADFEDKIKARVAQGARKQ